MRRLLLISFPCGCVELLLNATIICVYDWRSYVYLFAPDLFTGLNSSTVDMTQWRVQDFCEGEGSIVWPRPQAVECGEGSWPSPENLAFFAGIVAHSEGFSWYFYTRKFLNYKYAIQCNVVHLGIASNNIQLLFTVYTEDNSTSVSPSGTWN